MIRAKSGHRPSDQEYLASLHPSDHVDTPPPNGALQPSDDRSSSRASHAAAMTALVQRLELATYSAKTLEAILDLVIQAKTMLDDHHPVAATLARDLANQADGLRVALEAHESGNRQRTAEWEATRAG